MRFSIALIFSLLLVGCGGGGGGESTTNVPPIIQPPGPTYTLTINISGSGTVAPTITRTYSAGEVITLTATPGAGYIFAGWSGTNQNSNALTNTATMPAGDLVVFAFFQFTANG